MNETQLLRLMVESNRVRVAAEERVAQEWRQAVADVVGLRNMWAIEEQIKMNREAPPPDISEFCPARCEDGWVIVNDKWPKRDPERSEDDQVYRKRCPYVDEVEYSAAHPTYWRNY